MTSTAPTATGRPVILAIAGASGAPYAVRLLEMLVAAGRSVHLTISPAGREVLRQELGITIDLRRFVLSDLCPAATVPGAVQYHHYEDFFTPIASGSFLTAGMVICPCSVGTLSAIAYGQTNNLLQRAAEVQLKERRKLIAVTRETPLSLIQIDSMRKLTEAGGIVLPASPGFYHGVNSVQDLVDFVVARILDQLGVQSTLMRRWCAAEVVE